MFAILETGGKQYKVEEGDILEVELLGEKKEQEVFIFENVLLLNGDTTKIGTPYVKNAKVKAKILSEIKAEKIIVFKKKSKKQYRKTQGHRQRLHKILIEKIEVKAEAKPKTAAEPKAAKPTTKKKEN